MLQSTFGGTSNTPKCTRELPATAPLEQRSMGEMVQKLRFDFTNDHEVTLSFADVVNQKLTVKH